MTYDPETLCTLISMQLSRFAGSGNYWTIYDPRWPGMIAIRLEQLGERYVPVDGAKIYAWLQTPGLTWQDVVSLVARKRKQLNRQHTRNNGQR